MLMSRHEKEWRLDELVELGRSPLDDVGSSSAADEIVIHFVTSDRACALHLWVEGSNLLTH